jgi:peptidoglycan/LPS O-acetylase OafA/YrhL
MVPLLLAAASGSLAVVFPRNDTADTAAVVLLPMMAALIRASIGLRQLSAICRKRPSILRQVLFAAAIATLLMFEMYSGFLVRGGVPWPFWWPAAALYVIYLAFIVCSVRPSADQPPQEFSG